jgi:hypothetical protein
MTTAADPRQHCSLLPAALCIVTLRPDSARRAHCHRATELQCHPGGHVRTRIVPDAARPRSEAAATAITASSDEADNETGAS